MASRSAGTGEDERLPLALKSRGSFLYMVILYLVAPLPTMAPEVTDIERYHLRLTRAMTCGDISNLTSTCSNEVHISQRDKDIFLLAATERMRAIIAESGGRETEQADS